MANSYPVQEWHRISTNYFRGRLERMADCSVITVNELAVFRYNANSFEIAGEDGILTLSELAEYLYDTQPID